MPRQTSIQLTEATEQQVASLRERGFGTFTDIVRIAIDRMYTQETAIMKHCPFCGRSFDTRLVDIDRHVESCREHGRDVVRRNLERIERGERPTRTGI